MFFFCHVTFQTPCIRILNGCNLVLSGVLKKVWNESRVFACKTGALLGLFICATYIHVKRFLLKVIFKLVYTINLKGNFVLICLKCLTGADDSDPWGIGDNFQEDYKVLIKIILPCTCNMTVDAIGRSNTTPKHKKSLYLHQK